MQEGDLADGPLPDILRLLAAAHATGGVHVRRRDERGESADAVLFLREGRLYAATAPGPRPLLGVRLVAAGAVTRDALEEALESQAGDLAGWRLGELLVHLGYVDGEIVAEFVVEQILDTVAEVSAWAAGGWRFRRGEKTREADGLSLDIEDVLERVVERRQSWSDLEQYAGGAAAIPHRVQVDEALTAQQIPLVRALLREVDGVRTLAELATRCGLTTYEAGYVLAQLIEVGAVRLAARADEPAPVTPATPTANTLPVIPAAPVTPAEPAASGVPASPAEPRIDARPRVDAEPVRFDAADPLGLADLLDRASLDAPAPAPPPTDPLGSDDLELDLATQLAVLARQAEEARWAAEARRCDEVRARRAGTGGTGGTAASAGAAEPPTASDPPVPTEAAGSPADAPVEPPVVAPYVPIGLVPLPGELPTTEEVAPAAEESAAMTAIADSAHLLAEIEPPDPTFLADLAALADVTDGLDRIDRIDEADSSEVPLVAPYEPIGLVPIDTFGSEPTEPGGWTGEDGALPDAVAAEVPALEAPAGEAPVLEVVADVAPAEELTAEPAPEPPDLVARDVPAPRLPTRSSAAPTEPAEPAVADLPGALATLRGAIDLEALDDAETPVGAGWTEIDQPEQPVAAAPVAAELDEPAVELDRNALQAALAEFGADAVLDAEPAAAEPGWLAAAPTWNADAAHDFTPDEDGASTDTAALLRELSFLGLDDGPTPARPPAPPRTPAPRQVPVPAGKPKRKSIFGR